MKRKHNENVDDSPILTDEDKVQGFSITSHGHSVMLLRHGKSVAWFSAAISAETVRAMVRLIESCEEVGQTVNK